MMGLKQSNDCYHCSLPIPLGFNQAIEILGENRQFCCFGCYSVAETILNNGFVDYYKYRTEVAITPDQVVPKELSLFDDQGLQQDYLHQEGDSYPTITLISESIRCSACAWLIEKKLAFHKNITRVQVNVTRQTITLSWKQEQLKLSELLKLLYQIGYPAEPYNEAKVLDINHKSNNAWLRRLGLAGLGMMQVMMYAVALYIGAFDNMSNEHRNFLRIVSFLVATPVLFYSGYPFYISAIKSIRHFKLNMDVPISLALLLAYSSSIFATLENSGEVYFDSVTMFVFFLLIGRYLEFRARKKVTEQIYKKDKLKPLFVDRLIKYPGSLDTQKVAINKVKPGDKIFVKPGATLLFDGVLLEGSSDLNEAMLNGEFLPVTKKLGDSVLAASINTTDSIVIEVINTADKSYWTSLQSLQEEALLGKPKIALLADKIARYFVLAIIALALLTYSYWIMQESSQALWITISVLVVSCPCALSLATPIALTCGIQVLNKSNLLIKNQGFFESINTITDIVFDKTGTLTKGKLTLDKFINHTHNLGLSEQQYSDKELLSMIAEMEFGSEHPIAQAFMPYANNSYQISNLIYFSSSGVSALVDGVECAFGNKEFVRKFIKITNDSNKDMNDGCLYLIRKDKVIAQAWLKDETREEALTACKLLRQKGLDLHILSGDPSSQVEKLATELEVIHWENNCSAEQKLSYVQKLQKQSKNVLVIGDGLNDAPVMAAANTSVAMGQSSDLTRVSADSYLLSNNLNDLSYAFNKSKQIIKVIKENLSWAVTYNLIMVPFAMIGWIAPYVAAIGMSLSSVIVVLNSLKLNANKLKESAQ